MAIADDWVAVKLRGVVVQFVDGDWVPLRRGDVVPDDRAVQTTRSGHVQFQRDGETIDLGPQTAIQISDRDGRRYTTVLQHFGVVTVEAEVQNVEHFAVRTHHLAAVVKGTIFTVTASETNSEVEVVRGRVAVEDLDTHETVVITAGESAGAGADSSTNFLLQDGSPTGSSGPGTIDPGVSASGSATASGAGGAVLGGAVELGGSSSGVGVSAGVGGVSASVGVGDGGIDVSAGLGDTNLSVNVGGDSGLISGVTGTVGGLLGGLL